MNFGSPSIAFFPMQASLQCADFTLLLFSVFLLFFAGATESVGQHMLEACNNNLEMAVTMFLDGDGMAQEPSTSSSSAASSSRAPPSEYFFLNYFVTIDTIFFCFVLFCIGFFVLLDQFKQWPRSWRRKRTCDTLSVWDATPVILMCFLVFQWSASTHSPKAGHTGGTRTIIWR